MATALLIVDVQQGMFMESVPPHGHKVPMLLAGTAAAQLVDLLKPLGMQVEAVGDKIGQASSIKMFRSVIIKGMEALMLELIEGHVAWRAISSDAAPEHH